MSLLLQMRIICNVKHCYAIRLKVGENLLTSLTKLMLLEAKAIICPTIKKIYFYIVFNFQHLYC